MKVLVDQDIPLAENVRLIKRLYKVNKDKDFPEGLKFAYQFLFRKEKWLEIARMDNYTHDLKKKGVHVHKIGAKEVIFKNMTFEECEEYIVNLGFNLIRCLE